MNPETASPSPTAVDLETGIEGPDSSWMRTLLCRAGMGADPGTDAILVALKVCENNADSVAGRVAHLAHDPLDRLILAALYLEGLHLDLRRKLRSKKGTTDGWDDDMFTRKNALSAERMVQWLGGNDQRLRQRIAERLLPQSGLAAKRLIERSGAATPLDGGVRLTSFLSSLLYPGDEQGERVLDPGLRLVLPTERLADVILTKTQRPQLEQFLALCRADQGGGKSVLLWGRSGAGKTLTARAIAGELGLPLLLVRTQNPDFEADLIEKAAAAAQIEGAAIFFDECGRWLDKENHLNGPSSEAATLLQLLQDHDGVVIAAINQGWLRLSEAFQRRFPTQISYGETDDTHRSELWRRHLKRPIVSAILDRASRIYDISGGLIRNAAARLNLGSAQEDISWTEMQAAVSTQLHGLLDWKNLDRTSRAGRIGLDRESRRSLQSLAHLWKKNALFSYEDNRRTGRGLKVLLRGDDSDQWDSLAYLAHCLGRTARTVNLQDLMPKDTNSSGIDPADLRRAVEACSLTNGLPVLTIARAEGEKEAAAWRLAGAFAEAGGLGVLCLMAEIVPPERFSPQALGPWITVRSKPRIKLQPVLVGLERRQLQVCDPGLMAQLLGLRTERIELLARWALALQRIEENDEVPGIIMEKYVAAALKLLFKPGIQTPIF
ncbi:MAG TPA: ATP-binding protein [bacterium]|nr:ATP-binding protein [bacterium]